MDGTVMRDQLVASGYVAAELVIEHVSDAVFEARLAARRPAPTYRQLRAKDYAAELGREPGVMNAIGDSIDVIVKQFIQMRQDGQVLIPEMETHIDKITAIKARHPIPE